MYYLGTMNQFIKSNYTAKLTQKRIYVPKAIKDILGVKEKDLIEYVIVQLGKEKFRVELRKHSKTIINMKTFRSKKT